MSALGEFQFNPNSAEFAENPYATYQQLREHHPSFYYPPWDIWLFSAFADVHALATDPRLLRTLNHTLSQQALNKKRQAENWADTPNISRYVRVNILDSEGEQHGRLRKLVFKSLTPSKIKSLQQHISESVSAQIASLKESQEVDFINVVAPIAAATIGRLLGIPAQDCYLLGGWSDKIVRFFEQVKSPATIHSAEQATAEFADYLQSLADKRRANPTQDLISDLILAESNGKLSNDELISTCMILLMAGYGSTIDVSGTGLLALLQHPVQIQAMRDNPNLRKTAVQEMFRFESPLPFFHRVVAEDMQFNGQQFKQGTKIGLLYGAANRDPNQFQNPDQFVVSRSPNRHIAFGAGAHFCLGNHLARLEMETLFGALIESFNDISLATAKPIYKRGISTRGLESLPIKLNA